MHINFPVFVFWLWHNPQHTLEHAAVFCTRRLQDNKGRLLLWSVLESER